MGNPPGKGAALLQKRLFLDSRRVRRAVFDSCSVSRLADCADRGRLAEDLRSHGVSVVLSLSTAVEVVATPDVDRRRMLCTALQLLGGSLIGAPADVELLTGGADEDAWWLRSDERVEAMVRAQQLGPDLASHVEALRRKERAQARATNAEALEWYREHSDPAEPTQSYVDALFESFRNRSLLRQVRNGILETAREESIEERRINPRVLRNPSVRCWAAGWIYVAREACIAKSRNAQRGLPGSTDIGLLAFLPFVDAFVSDDAGLLGAARAARQVAGARPPWVGCFEELRARML